MESCEILSFNIWKYKKEHNMTTDELAALCNLTSKQMRAIENAKLNLNISLLDKLSLGMGLAPSQLMKQDAEFSIIKKI